MAEGKAGVMGLRQIIMEVRHSNFTLEAEVLEGLSRGGTSSSSPLKESTLIATGERVGGREASQEAAWEATMAAPGPI